jgi:hypothetical protein
MHTIASLSRLFAAGLVALHVLSDKQPASEQIHSA